jgi:dihydrofolate reductase
MRKIRYSVAMSLDGYIAGPNGEADWIVADPAFNFADLWAQFDTLLMGRRTYQVAVARFGKKGGFQGKKTFVASRTLHQADYPNATILFDLTRDWIQQLRSQPGKDVWLMGGGEIFQLLLGMQEIDLVEVSIVPILLGGGVAMLPSPATQTRLTLASHKAYPSGLISLVYEVQR